MLDNIIRFSLRNKYFILSCALVLVILGIRTATTMDVDVFPDLTAPTVVILTDAHGMASEEIERLVTFPIETAVNGATDVRRVRSASSQGFSFVWVEFDWGTDIFKARQIVSEKLINVSAQLPGGVEQPMLAPQSSIMGEVFFVGMQADSTSMMDLRTIAEWDVKPLLMAIEGVSQVTIIGGEEKQYHVLADPVKMQYYRVAFHDLARTCEGMSRNAAGGVIRQYGNEFVVRGIARTSDLEALENTYIQFNHGKPVRIRDVAEVRIGSSVKMGVASRNTQEAIIVSVSKQPHTNTLKLTGKIESQLAGLQQVIPPDVKLDTGIFRQADFIGSAINNVTGALIEGSIFVVIILLLFLGSFRTTIISLLAIPLSLFGAILVLKTLGLTMNTMSLGGMAIAIGALVDDAIIDVENVYKRLRQNRQKKKEERQTSFMVVFEASREIRASILNATLIIIVSFLPLFFLSGMEGRMLKPLGISFIVSLFVSLVVAMTLTPLLCNMLLTNDRYLARNQKDKWLARTLSNYYEQSLGWALKHKSPVIVSALGLFILAVVAFTQMGRSFLPEFNEGSLTISAICKPGTSLDDSDRLGSMIERELLSIPEVVSTARRTGRGDLDEHSQSTNSAEIDVNFNLKERTRAAFMEEVRERLASIPAISFSVGQPLGHRIDHMLSGTRANIAIKLFGPDLNTLFTLGNEIKAATAGIRGLVDVNVEQQIEVPQIQIRAHRDMLANYGIPVERFNEFIDLAFGGEKVADIQEGQRNFGLVVKLPEAYTGTVEGLRSAWIDTDDGKKVSLEQVADIVSVTGPGMINRENVQRKIVVSANVAGRDLRGVVRDIRRQIRENVILPEGYRVACGGQFESEARASQILLITSVIAIVIIYLLLFQEFRNFTMAGIILVNLPLALIGGVFSIYVTSGMLSIPAIIGFITLFGIATRNGILLISKYQHLEKQEVTVRDIILKGSSDRLNPILMTALTAALALIPLAIQGDLPGNEIQSPMARVILGGLLTSTLLNVYVVPVVYSVVKNRQILKYERK